MLELVNGEVLNLSSSLSPHAALTINASIVRHKDKIWTAYRTGNLDQYDAKNYLTQLDDNLQPLSHIPITTENGNTAFEDVRLFSFGYYLLAIYTYLPGNKVDGWEFKYGVGIGVLDTERGLIVSQHSLRHHSSFMHSKNWVPYAYNKDLFLVTDFEPFLNVLRFINVSASFDCDNCYRSEVITQSWNFGQVRGGTPFIVCPFTSDEWQYSFVHSDIRLPNGMVHSRFYVYTVLRLNARTKEVQYHKIPMAYSSIEDSAIYQNLWLSATRNLAMRVVFPMGILNYNQGVLMSYGNNDCETYAVFYSWDYLYGLFNSQ